MYTLDYSITSPQERNEIVKKILEQNPTPSEKYLEILADYLVLCMEKEEKKKKKILTENRMSTVNKREMSFEKLASQLENGEDGIYSLIANDKNIIFQPKISITQKDLKEIPYLKQLREAIKDWEKLLSKSEGKKAYLIKKSLIEMRKDQYIIKNAYQKPVSLVNLPKSKFYNIELKEKVGFDANGYCIPIGISLINPKICSIILCNYSKLKEDSWGRLESDIWHLLFDFDQISEKALKNYPVYREIVINKIDGLQNIEIKNILYQKFNIEHSAEYISSLWRKKIPNLIASTAEDIYLNYYFLSKEKGMYKRCGKCKTVKLAHNKYFSKNKTSKDGFYSICKSCRNLKKR